MSSAKRRLFCLGLNVLKLTKGSQRVRVLTTMILYNLQKNQSYELSTCIFRAIDAAYYNKLTCV